MNLKMETAIELACRESGSGRHVMVLVPSVHWATRPLTSELSDVYGTLHFRCTTRHASLKSVTIDTLILVGSDDPAWDAKGEAIARERLRTSLDPRVIEIGEEAAPDVCFFCGKERNPYSSEQYRWMSVHSHAERCCMKCFPQHRERGII